MGYFDALVHDRRRTRRTQPIAGGECSNQAVPTNETNDLLKAGEIRLFLFWRYRAGAKHMAHHLLSCEGRVQPENNENFDLRAALGKSL